jgi:hypothetical protein
MGVGGQHQAPAALTPGKTGYSLYMRLGETPGAGLDGRGIRSPDHPARSESLYRLSYPERLPKHVAYLKQIVVLQ